MDFSIPPQISRDLTDFKRFLERQLVPNLAGWHRRGQVSRSFYESMGTEGWFGWQIKRGRLEKLSALRRAVLMETLAGYSPGIAVANLVHEDLGLVAVWRYGSLELKQLVGDQAASGATLLCLASTESGAGSDVAGISTRAPKVDGGWRLSGTKTYITSGLLADLAVVTAVSDPEAARNRKLSLFLVDLAAAGVDRKKLNKQVWMPSDMARLRFNNVFVPDSHLMGQRGRGLQLVLHLFSYSRVPISALTLGTAVASFKLALEHGRKREVAGHRIVDLQAKSFEIADLYARMEAVRLMIFKASWAMDQEEDFRLEASLAKYMAVGTAQRVTGWSADMFGAASVIRDHPIHSFPLDAWAASLAEGTQDVQKLIIFREIMKRQGG